MMKIENQWDVSVLVLDASCFLYTNSTTIGYVKREMHPLLRNAPPNGGMPDAEDRASCKHSFGRGRRARIIVLSALSTR